MEVQLHVFDRFYKWQGQIGEYNDLRATRAHLMVSDMEFTSPSDLDVRPDLAAKGARVVAFLDGEGFTGEQFVGGLVSDAGSFVPGEDLNYRVVDDYQILGRILGWAVPGSPAGAQGAAAYWRTIPSNVPAETALKAVLRDNIARLGLPYVVAPDQGRGKPLELSYRFHPLPDRFMPKLAASGIGISVTLVEGEGLLIDCYESTLHPIPLTADDGVIEDGKWARINPTATRAVGAAQGEGIERDFFGPIIDEELEAEYGFCGEIVIDARDTNDGTTVLQRLRDALAENGPKVSVSLELTETADFTYGPYRVGDRVPVEYEVGSPPVVDVLTEAIVNHSTAVSKPEVTFQVGERTDDESDVTWRSLAALAAGQRDLTVR